MTKKKFNRNWFCRVEIEFPILKDNFLAGYDRIQTICGDKFDKVLKQLENPSRYQQRSNCNVVIKPYHKVTLTFIAK